jgi:hypothetical protein
MKNQGWYQKATKKVIQRIEITEDKLSSRGGLALFLRYIESIGFFQVAGLVLGHLRKSKKGQAIELILLQIIAYFVDGTRKSIRGFDEFSGSNSQAALFEIEEEELVSSDQVKRFFKKFLGLKYLLFRKVLSILFVWRLKIVKPAVIDLYLDTMVLDNDDALTREGVRPTYKKKKGFQPLQLIWGNLIVDGLFRSGEKHSNHGKDVQKMLHQAVKLIREKYKAEVPIIVRMDSGFLSEENFAYFEKELNIHYICAGKQYPGIKDYVSQLGKENWQSLEGKNNGWSYIEFGSKLDAWKTYRRTIYTSSTTDENGQLLLEFARPDNILYTNMGMNETLDQRLINASEENALGAEAIIKRYHQNGESELVHRSLKEFAGSEKLPFKRFGANGAYYYLMIIAHFLFQAYKEDVGECVVSIKSYPNTARRKLIDFSDKIVKND